MSKFKNSVKTCVLLLVFCLALDSLAYGQWVGRGHGRRQGRREGGIVLPTPPFNPDAGILRSRKGRARHTSKPAPRRAATRQADNRNPHPGTPRRRRGRRGRQAR
ncbi:MAG: hypothetical protein M3416_05995 [Acidobacteriota bacterium]|nr:hypothetical protein [Acidobacteriota bacterium]